jgi:serine/threonine protein kinase
MVDTPAQLGRYRLVEVLGTGGFGTVYRAHDPMLKRDVALKALAADLSAVAEDRARFLDEARALAALHHPNILAVYDVGEQDGRPYFTMELIAGETVAALLARRGRVGLGEAVEIVGQVASALDRVHAAGLVHRDIKDANVMVVRGPQGDGIHVVLMDFGIALSPHAERLTREGHGLGTPGYVAPEQIGGKDVGPAADIYALGVLTYQLLAGNLPFTGSTAQVLYAHAHQPAPSLALQRNLPAAVAQIVSQALAKKPVLRPATAGGFAARLRRAARMPGTPLESADGAAAGMEQLSGQGSAARTITLSAGVRCLQISHRVWGGRRFTVTLSDAAGGSPDVLVATTGPYTGTAWRRIREGGSYLLTIEAEGEWSIGIR